MVLQIWYVLVVQRQLRALPTVEEGKLTTIITAHLGIGKNYDLWGKQDRFPFLKYLHFAAHQIVSWARQNMCNPKRQLIRIHPNVH